MEQVSLSAELFINAFTVSMERNLPSISTPNPVANVTVAFSQSLLSSEQQNTVTYYKKVTLQESQPGRYYVDFADWYM